MKKVIKKKSTKVVAAKKHVAPVVKSKRSGYTHSEVLSNNALMGLAVFFALVGLFVVMMYQKQAMEFDRYQVAHRNDSLQYLARPSTPAPKMMKK